MKYRKLPVEIEAVKWTGENCSEMTTFLSQSEREVKFIHNDQIIIETLEGKLKASRGDYIIKGVHGEFYPCKPDIFIKSYEPVPQKTKESSEQTGNSPSVQSEAD